MPTIIAANYIFHILDLLSAILMLIDSFLSFNGSFEGVFLPIYRIIFAAMIGLFVFYIPPRLGAMVPFYMNFLGRGFSFIFLGCLCIGEGSYSLGLAAAVITIGTAFIYIILWIFVQFGAIACSLPPPFMQARQAANKESGATTTTQMTTVTTTTTNEPDVNAQNV